ncbi:MAG: hypothetical protein RL095_3780 [Verrucomicrobiota bacterium]|jgi:DNA-binding beta-propeller fold protein YncE
MNLLLAALLALGPAGPAAEPPSDFALAAQSLALAASGDAPSAPLGPATLVASADGRLVFVAQLEGKRIDAVDLASRKILRSLICPAPPSGLCLSPDGQSLAITCAAAESRLLVVDAANLKIRAAFPAGHFACAPCWSPDGRTLYFCGRFTHDVAVFDLVAGRELRRIAVAREPISCALTPDGRHLLVSNHQQERRSDADEVASSVSVVDLAADKEIKRLRLPSGSTLLRDIRISPDGRYAAVGHTLGKFQLPLTQIEHGWINTNALSLVDLGKLELVATVLLDDIDRGAANPWGLAFSGDGRTLCVGHAGTHEISLVNFPALLAKLAAKSGQTQNDLSLLSGIRQRVKLAGQGPRGLAVAGNLAVAAEHFSDSLALVDLKSARPEELPLGPPPQPSPERRGEALFNDATLCFQGWQSCASCHAEDARGDSLNWDLLNDGMGNPKNSKSLVLAHLTPPMMSLGVRKDAPTATRAGLKFILFSVQPEETAAALDAYIASLKPIPSPKLVQGRLSQAAERGKLLFERFDCQSCHPPPLFTDLRKYDLGDAKGTDAGKKIDVPSLVECWRTAPYLHDGSLVTLRELFEKNRHNLEGETPSAQELADLLEYLQSL